MEAITLIGNILLNYKILLKNSVPTDSIDHLICRWTKSNNVNMINKTSVQKQMLIDLKKKDKSCTTLSRFTEIYHGTYITNECLMLLQELIDRFIVHGELIKQTLQNLLPLMKLLANIDLVSTQHRLTFVRKLRKVTTFFNLKLYDVIYREALLIFLVHQRDSKLLTTTNYSKNEVNTSTTTSMFSGSDDTNMLSGYDDTSMLSNSDVIPTTNPLMCCSPKCFLVDYITDINNIRSIRSVSKQMEKYYDSKTMTSIALFNLKNIIQHFFMLNVDKFISAMLSCDAIIGGSVVAQSFYGNASELQKDSDLDVYYQHDSDVTVLRQLIFTAGYQPYSKELSAELRATYFYSNHVTYRSSPSILSVNTFKSEQGRMIQLIAVRPPFNLQLSTFNFGRYVISTYDLSFLKNFFDGTTLYTCDFHGVVTKSGSIDCKLLEAITASDDMFDSYESLYSWYRAYTATLIRCIKYQKRGFYIDNVPSFSLLKMLAL